MNVFTLTLIRHGQTKANKERIIQGHLDVPLSEIGVAQANYLAQRLKNEKYTHMYSSDLSRAAQTAQIIKDENQSIDKNIALQLDERLRERGFGEVEGKSVAEVKELTKGKSLAEFIPVGAETDKQLKERVESFFKDFCQMFIDTAKNQHHVIYPELEKSEPTTYRKPDNYMRDKESSTVKQSDVLGASFEDFGLNANILLVSHGGFIRELVNYFVKLGCDIPGGKEVASRISPNTGLSKFVIYGNLFENLKIKCLLIHDQTHLTEKGENGDNFSIKNEEAL